MSKGKKNCLLAYLRLCDFYAFCAFYGFYAFSALCAFLCVWNLLVKK